MNVDFGTGNDRIFNFISLGLLGASFFACIITILIFLFGGSEEVVLPPVATSVSFPTATETPPPVNTRAGVATFTPTFTFTPTLTQSVTPSPTLTLTSTLTPTSTITQTSLPTDPPEPTGTPVPTLMTPDASPSPFLFALQDDPAFTSNLNSSACAWQGIGGQVLDLNGNAITANLVITVAGGGLAQARTSNPGDNTLYGAGGYEVQLANSINTQTYFVRLETEFGTPYSETIQVAFPGTCEGNLGLLTFRQVRAN